MRFQRVVGAALVAGLGARIARRQWPAVALADRLRNLADRGLKLRRPVTIDWDRHHIPFIEADDDRDLAVALGVVHAHLRLAQMELLRRVAFGRLSEVLGPLMIDLDHALRILGFGRAAERLEACLPDETRAWLSGFVAGVNHQLVHAPRLPPEFAWLDLDREPWTVRDVLGVGRLAAADVTWFVWRRLLTLWQRHDWPTIWDRLVRSEAAPIPSLAASGELEAALRLGVTRSGSNAFAVAASRSATGAAWLAGDPHLSLALPNLWLIAAYRSPTHNAAGLMIPGLPIMAIGRNPWIAWGGTNLHAAASALYDVSALPESALAEHPETIRVRWSRAERVVLRESAFGPLLSDAALFRNDRKRLALRWVGHRPTDEITAFLRLSRARDWAGFRAALDSFAVPGQNLVYADVRGTVGWTIAAQLPRRPAHAIPEFIAPTRPSPEWDELVTTRELPFTYDPPEGFVASANDRPPTATISIGHFFSGNDRIERLRERLRAAPAVDLAMISALQRDVFSASSIALRELLIALVDAAVPHDQLRRREQGLLSALRDWDGCYREDSAGALAHELLLCRIADSVYGARARHVYFAAWEPLRLLSEDLATLDPQRARAALRRALAAAAALFARYRAWGAFHRLHLAHFLAALPLLRRRMIHFDAPASGSRDTLLKTAHGLTHKRHAAEYGANARYVFDLSGDDRNHVVLLGGQDGWLGSSTSLDQVGLWREGGYLAVPLRPETARARASHQTCLLP